MNKLHVCGLVLLLLVAMVVSPANAFDNNRQGFMLSVGAGPSMTNYEMYYDGDESKFGGGTDFKIGGGINNQVQLYWLARTAFFSQDYPRYTLYGGFVGTESVTYMNGFYGGGISYFFRPQAPSWYMVGALGLVTLSAPFDDDFDDYSESGTGFSFGAGYEFSRHWMIEASWSVGDIENTTFQTWKVVIGYLAY